MSLGVVPLVVDYAGPGELVTPETGVAVPIGSREEIVVRLRVALEALSEDPGKLLLMANRARARALTLFTWEAKARQVAEVYDWVRNAQPDLPTPSVLS